MRQPIPFGKYLLLDRISVGGMAEVFKAKSYGVEGFEKVLAIKRILPSMGEDRDFIKMFIDEAKIAGQLAHANIWQIFELGRSDGAHFIAMEYIWGKDLLQLQNRLRKLKQSMAPVMAAFITGKVCEGLDYAHRKRDAMGRALEIVHRDCSPQNVLISYEGEVKLIDFGIAKAASRSSRTMAGVLKGKFGYMSPEQVRGLPLDRRSDVFALGTILYESLTGERLFQGESDFSTLEKVRNVAIIPPRQVDASIPEELERITLRALAREQEERYQWCSEMGADLQQFLMNQPQVFTAKSLSTWLKDAFALEIERERDQLESFKRVGRDGLIAGVPQADAKLDVVEHMGEAGQADDPTILGGPSFDDMEPDPQAANVPAAGMAAAAVRAWAAHGKGDEFAEEAPTEIFGEISDPLAPAADASRAALARAQTVNELGPGRASPPELARVPTMPPARAGSRESAAAHYHNLPGSDVPTMLGPPSPFARVPPYHSPEAAPLPHRAAAAAAMAQTSASGGHAVPYPGGVGVSPFTPSGVMVAPPGTGMSSREVPSAPAVPVLPYYDITHEVQALPTPSDVRALEPMRRRRPSLAKDIAIGVAIAAVVLGLFAGGKYLFFGGAPGSRPAKADAPAGPLVITVPDPEAADVFVNDEKRGVVEGGGLTLEDVAAGDYRVRVVRAGAPPCEQVVTLAAGKVASIKCAFAAAPAPETPAPPSPVTGSHDAGAAAVDPGRPMIDATAHIEDPGRESHAARLDKRPSKRDRGDGSAGDSDGLIDAGASGTAAAPEPGFLLAYTTPYAKVVVDGVDTGKITPITPRAKIPLSPGDHKVTFVVGREKMTFRVKIVAGKDTKLIKDLQVKVTP